MKGSEQPSIILTLLILIGEFLFGKKKRSKPSVSQIDASTKQKRNNNCNRMKSIADRFQDHTAEVIPFWVRGRARVKKFREVNIGERVDLRLVDDDMKVFFDNEYIAELYPESGSRLEDVLIKGIRFNAYLGGRDLSYRFDDNIDSCSIIVFYKFPGVAPTKVIIKD